MFNNKQETPEIERLKHYLFKNKGVQKNRLTIGAFYAYVFGDKVAIKPISYIATKKIKPLSSDKQVLQPAKKALSLETIQTQKYAKMQTMCDDFKNALGTSILANPHFRAMLRQTNPSLEAYLFGNAIDKVEQCFFPTDGDIKRKGLAQNEVYGYFDKNAEHFAFVMEQFIILFKGCKLVADYIETNNDAHDAVAALHAYKILVLFGADTLRQKNPFALLEAYLKNYQGYEQPSPIHDCLARPLPQNTKQIQDLKGWRKLINHYGPKAIDYFQSAGAIEMHLNNKAPVDLKEAAKIASLISYTQYNAYPALAKLCMQYHINESIFERCLAIEKNKKAQDNLPKITINGVDIGEECAGYYLVKLPINDPRAYVLGHITNCCQSIGGDSEACVIDGITRKNNGFYVLLKSKQTGMHQSSPWLTKDKINYAEYAIVGQGYAWISLWGNMTFDSWENLRAQDNIKYMVPWWAAKLPDDLESSLIASHVHSSGITMFLVSFKGKVFFIDLKEQKITEIALSNTNTQKLDLFFNPFKPDTARLIEDKESAFLINAIHANQEDVIAYRMLTAFGEQITQDKHSDIVRLTIGRGGKTPHLFRLNPILTNPEKIAEGSQYNDSKSQSSVFLNTEKHKSSLSSLIKSLQSSYLDALLAERFLIYLDKRDFISKQWGAAFHALLSAARYKDFWRDFSSEIAIENSSLSQVFAHTNAWEIVLHLHLANALTKDFLVVLADSWVMYKRSRSRNSYGANASLLFLQHAVMAMTTLDEAQLLSLENRKALLEAINCCQSFTAAFQKLKHKGLLTQTYIQLVINAGVHAEKIGCLDGLTSQHILIYLSNHKHIHSLTAVFVDLRCHALLTEKYIEAVLFSGGSHATLLSSTLICLKKANLLETSSYELFMHWMTKDASAEKARQCWDINVIMKHLSEKQLLTSDVFKSLLDYADCAKDIVRVTPYLFTNAHWEMLLKNLKAIAFIECVLLKLHESRLLTSDTCTLALSKAYDSDSLDEALNLIDETEPELFNQLNYQWLIEGDSMLKASALTALYLALENELFNKPSGVKSLGFFEHDTNPSYTKLLNYLMGSPVDFETIDSEILNTTFESLFLALNHLGYPMPEPLQVDMDSQLKRV